MTDAPTDTGAREIGDRRGVAPSILRALISQPQSVRRALVAFALLTASLPFIVRVVLNLPGSVLATAADSYELFVVTATVGPGIAALGLAVGTADRVGRVGLLTLALFAPLALVADAAYLPAGIALTTATALLAWTCLRKSGPEPTGTWAGRRIFAISSIIAIGGSLAATTGLAPTAVRQGGTVAMLFAAATAGTTIEAEPIDWAIGALAGSLVYAAGTVAPYVTGAVALVAGGVIGGSLPLLALGVTGILAATVASARRGTLATGGGALLLFVGGVPVTVQRALAVALAGWLLLGVNTDE